MAREKSNRARPAGFVPAVLALWFTTVAGAAERQVLRGHVPAAATRSQFVERLAPAKHLGLTIALPLRNQAALTNLLQQLYNPAGPNYRRYLTPEQFAEQFGPRESDYQAVIAFARSHGLTVTGTHPNRTLLEVSATVAGIEKALQVSLGAYRHPTEGRTFHAPDVAPSVELALPILAIGGLDDFARPRPMGLRTNSFRKKTAAVPYVTGSGPRGNFIGKDFRSAYAPGVALDGTGQSVGLAEFEGYYPGDITAYENLAGLRHVPLTNMFLNGFNGEPGGNNIEVALDICMAISMAPGLSSVIVYEGIAPNDILNRMATDNAARQLSCSWGFGPQVDPARQQIFQQFAAQGQSFFQASGDLGAWAGAVFPPSDDPWVTVVGGTALTTSSADGSWLSEATWPASGGGTSTRYPIPIWQQAVSMSGNQGSPAMRNIPDVACLADDAIWVIVNNGEQGVVGGTSAAAPLWAGFTALANQQAAAMGQPPVGFVNPAIYAIGQGPDYLSAFHDITTGNNTNDSSSNRFFAVAGYDLCTGWGTPAGSNLIQALLAPVDALRLMPQTILAFTGRRGGPFSPATQNYLLTNAGATSLNWQFANGAPWLDVSPTNGTLAVGGPAATVTGTLTAIARNLSVGSYSASVWFTNLSDGFGQRGQMALEVIALPAITAQPASQAVFEGMTATFRVVNSSNAAVSFQWRHDNGIQPTNLSAGGNAFGTATSTLTISNVTPANVGAYSVVVSNALGAAISSNAFLTIVPWRPVITKHPADRTALPGEPVTLRVAAVGSQPLLYQWQKNGSDLVDGGNLVGAQAHDLTLSNSSPADKGNYAVIVSNAFGSVTSSAAALTFDAVTSPGINLITLHSFAGGNGGGQPNGLVPATNGMFFGTTQIGGSNSAGTVFQMTTNGHVTTLYSFTGGSDGAIPFAPPAPGPDGILYGTTFQGGESDNGTIFKMSAAGALTTLVSFDIANGDFPYAGLVLGNDRSFFGTSYQGGAFGRGTVYRVSTNGDLTTLYSFSNGNDGGHPAAGLAQDGDGNFYGTTYKGGNFGNGTLYRIASNGPLASLVSFNSTNGSFPLAGLAQGNDGNFYGVTSQGGAFTHGTVFRVTPSGLLTSLHSFTGGSDGRQPVGTLLQGSDGNFYGTTAYGGDYDAGTVFRIAPGGALATLVHFDGYNGAHPRAALVQGTDGHFYGTTQNGGANDHGLIFRFGIDSAPEITSQPASQTVFQGAKVQLSVAVFGSVPLSYQWQKDGTDLADAGNLSGAVARVLTLTNVMAANAGSYSVRVSNALGSVTSAGALLQVTSSPPFMVMQPTNQTLAPGGTARFTVSAFGNLPLTYRWQKDGNHLTDGANVSGSATRTLTVTNATEANNGDYSVIVTNALASATSSTATLTVVPVSAPGTRLATLHWFHTEAGGGWQPNGLTRASNGDLYGTTYYGSATHPIGNGTVFRMTTNGIFTTLVSFGSGTNGNRPLAALAEGADGNLYGTTSYGGAEGVGSVFKMTLDGTLTPLYSFTGAADGAYPFTALVPGTDGNFYGAAEDPYSSNEHIFKMTPDGLLANFYSFSGGADGDSPVGALVQGGDGNFYGMAEGGALGYGNVFKLTPGGTLTTLYTFANGTDGSAPAGALAQGTDGNFYGVTERNTLAGYAFYGTIFRITPAGQLTTLYLLNFRDGAYPRAGLIQGSDGNFYGTAYGETSGVGIRPPPGNGTIFRISPSGAFTMLVALDGFNAGAHPTAALVEGVDGSLYGTTTTGGVSGFGTVFQLSFTSAPQITSHPANRTAVAGTTAQFSVAVAGAPPLSYQWRKNGTNLTDGANRSGANARVLTLSNVAPADNGNYSVIVSNSLGSVPSADALLTVVSPPVFQTIRLTNGTVTLTWSATAGQKYQLQYKSILHSANWASLGNVVTATNAIATASDAIGESSQRFYRVVPSP